ncbi:MAG: HAD family hydrolase [Thermoplasmata archaeon]
MSSGPPYRAVSFDFWYTLFCHDADEDLGWKEARLRTLGELLVPEAGGSFSRAEIASAKDTADAQVREQARGTIDVDPGVLVRRYARVLDARFTVSPEEAARVYSAAGLAEFPPSLNPEFDRVARALDARGIPIIAISNTARREESWQAFLRPRTSVPLRHVLTSCEVGLGKPHPEIFRAASRRLGIPLSEILHVGDRWDLDVMGARGAGCGAVLYRGFWDRYPNEYLAGPKPPPAAERDVLEIDRLEEILDRNLLPGPPDGSDRSRAAPAGGTAALGGDGPARGGPRSGPGRRGAN